MNAPGEASAWVSANQRYMMAELTELRTYLERSPEKGKPASRQRSSVHRHLREARAAMPAPSALDTLCTIFGLSMFERRILLLCAGVELEGTFAASCAAAPGSGGNPWPSFGLALAAFPEAHWDALASGAALRRWRMIELTGGGPLVTSALRIDERILFFMTGVPVLDERVAGVVRPLRESSGLTRSQTGILECMEAVWAEASAAGKDVPVLQLCGADAGAKRSLATHLSAREGLNGYRLAASALPAHRPELEVLHRLWEREAILQNAVLLLDGDAVEAADSARDTALDFWIEQSRTLLIVATPEPRRHFERPVVIVDVSKPTRSEQRVLWEQTLGPAANSLNGELDRVTGQFDFGTRAIGVAAGRVAGSVGGTAELGVSLWEACRREARPRLEALAQRIQTRATWSDLVLPPPQMETLREIAVQVRHRAKVCEDWGFGEQSSRGLGLSALFSGPSGTGKTLAAEILANELQLDLFRIDLSAVVSKYIGETEKNLRRVFDAAEEGGAVLLFDEADAIFGKRSEVKDSHDRYANVEVSYLLQRMEAYRGLAILTTNMKDALDPAFLRRLRFVVPFPFPDQAHRAEIWRRVFPTKTPTENLDTAALSRLSIAGGHIRNIALNAAFGAAGADEPVRMKHVMRAARAEYAKLEKPLTEAESGGWK